MSRRLFIGDKCQKVYLLTFYVVVGRKNMGKNSDFQKITTAEGMVEYLSSSRRLENSPQIFHYTKLSSIISIIKNGYWILKKPIDMNDSLEYENWDELLWQGVFYASFMAEQKENLGMWGMYAQPWDKGVKVNIDSQIFKAWIKGTDVVYSADPNTYLVDKNKFYRIGDKAHIQYHAVAYSNYEHYVRETSETITCSSRKNFNIKHAIGNPLLAGYVKNDAWSYEREMRLRVVLDKSLECDAVAVKVTDELIRAMKIVAGPRFVGDIKDAIEKEVDAMNYGTSLFYGKLKSIPCDRCNKQIHSSNKKYENTRK